MDRDDCKQWLKDHGYRVPDRSRCVGCPFRSNADWVKLATESPEEFAEAVAFEKGIQKIMSERFGSEFVHYLHRRMVPLEEAIKILPKKKTKKQCFGKKMRRKKSIRQDLQD